MSLSFPACLLAVVITLSASAQPAPPPREGIYVATAYSVTGITASGEWTHRHVVAADPDVIPLGSRIKIRRAGRYSGEYVVADTGAKIIGRKLDIYMPSTRECMKFGSRRVRVRIIEVGDGTHAATKEADQAVKHDVDKDVAKGVVGNAATETDWKAKGLPAPKTAEPAAPPPN
jgi:3D (Asp-Asp-Asp) domain-containing protein